MNVIPCGLVTPSWRIPQMRKKVVNCFRRWHSKDVEIAGLLTTCDCYPSSPTPLRLQQVDLPNLHPLRWVEVFLRTFVSELFQRKDAVLLCNDDPIISCRCKRGLESMHMKHRQCGAVTYFVIAMQSRSRAPQEGLP